MLVLLEEREGGAGALAPLALARAADLWLIHGSVGNHSHWCFRHLIECCLHMIDDVHHRRGCGSHTRKCRWCGRLRQRLHDLAHCLRVWQAGPLWPLRCLCQLLERWRQTHSVTPIGAARERLTGGNVAFWAALLAHLCLDREGINAWR